MRSSTSNAYGHGHGFNQIELHVTSLNVQEDRGNAVAEARDPGCAAKMNEICSENRLFKVLATCPEEKLLSLPPSFKVPREDAQSERVEAFHSGVPDLYNFHRNRSLPAPLSFRSQSVTPPASCTPPHSSSSSSSMPISRRHHKAQARRTVTLQNLRHHKLKIFAHKGEYSV